MEIEIKGFIRVYSEDGAETAPKDEDQLRIEAWDDDLFSEDDKLGETSTITNGNFVINTICNWERDEILTPGKAEIYFRVFVGDNKIPSTHRGRWGNSGDGDVSMPTYTTRIRVAAKDIEAAQPQPEQPDSDQDRNDSKALNELRENLSYLVAYQPTPRDVGGGGTPRASEIEMAVSDALRDVLGKPVRRGDGRALQGALDHVFKFETVEGHRQVKFQAPTYTVTTDLGIELSGPQKSLYTFVESVGRELRKRIEIIRPLDTNSDPERTEPDRNGWLIELEELVGIIQNSIKLRPLRIDGAFSRLEEYRCAVEESFGFDNFQKNIQSIDDEQVYTEFLNAEQFQDSMQQAWVNFKKVQRLGEAPLLRFYCPEEIPELVGVLLADLEELLAVVDESVGEVYSDLDALGIGEEERRVTRLKFSSAVLTSNKITVLPKSCEYPTPPTITVKDQEITVAELFDWVRVFSKDKAPRILKDGGRKALPILQAEVLRLKELVEIVKTVEKLPDPMRHPRVTTSIKALVSHLDEVQELLRVEQESAV